MKKKMKRKKRKERRRRKEEEKTGPKKNTFGVTLESLGGTPPKVTLSPCPI